MLLNLILLGDFNVNFSNSHSSLFYKLKSLSDLYDLKQIINQPTHYSHSAALLLILTLFLFLPLSPLFPALFFLLCHPLITILFFSLYLCSLLNLHLPLPLVMSGSTIRLTSIVLMRSFHLFPGLKFFHRVLIPLGLSSKNSSSAPCTFVFLLF